jgi:threonine synthase
VGDPAILRAVDECARRDGLLLCPEGGATLAAYRAALAGGLVAESETAVLFNCATGLKYPLPDHSKTLSKAGPIDLAGL